MSKNSVEIAIRLKDDVSGGLKALQSTFKGVQESVAALDGGLSGLGKKLDSGAGVAPWTGKARNDLDALAKTARTNLDQAFAGKETTGQAGESASPAATRLEQDMEALRTKNRAELEELAAHGILRADLKQAQADKEVGIREAQDKQEKELAEERLAFTQDFVGNMSGVMALLYKSGLAQSESVFKMYQALAIAETTISTYKSAQAAYAQGVAFGGAGGTVLGAVMAAAAVAAGMARVAMIKTTQPKGYAFGGVIGGGLVLGADRGERADNVTIRATPGEYMLDRPAVRHYGVPVLEALRQRKIPRNVLASFGEPALPASRTRTAYALGGEVGTASLSPASTTPSEDALTIINVMDFQREFDRALASSRGRRVLVNVLGEEGIR
ncbi:MAG: hypothetical protein RRY20_03715 [Bilophila sp.]